jgi:hypothetical protein
VRLVRGRPGRTKVVTVDSAAEVVRTRWPGIQIENFGRTP